MQDEVVSRAQLPSVRDRLVCILNTCVLGYAPGFVTNDSGTMSTGRISAVLVTVIPRKVVLYWHWLLLRPRSIKAIISLTARSTTGSGILCEHLWGQSEAAKPECISAVFLFEPKGCSDRLHWRKSQPADTACRALDTCRSGFFILRPRRRFCVRRVCVSYQVLSGGDETACRGVRRWRVLECADLN
jgi:hypothetical protein